MPGRKCITAGSRLRYYSFGQKWHAHSLNKPGLSPCVFLGFLSKGTGCARRRQLSYGCHSLNKGKEPVGYKPSAFSQKLRRSARTDIPGQTKAKGRRFGSNCQRTIAPLERYFVSIHKYTNPQQACQETPGSAGKSYPNCHLPGAGSLFRARVYSIYATRGGSA